MKWILTLCLSLLSTLPLRAEIAVQEVTSPGGISAWLVEDHNIPFVALELRFRGGTSLDVAGQRGAINLMVGLLEEGVLLDVVALGGAEEVLVRETAAGLALATALDKEPDKAMPVLTKLAGGTHYP